MKLSTKRLKKNMFDAHKERCINCKMMDASQVCAVKLMGLGDSVSMRKAQIIDPFNQVCDKFEPSSFIKAIKNIGE
jgi:hypothetical protein